MVNAKNLVPVHVSTHLLIHLSAHLCHHHHSHHPSLFHSRLKTYFSTNPSHLKTSCNRYSQGSSFHAISHDTCTSGYTVPILNVTTGTHTNSNRKFHLTSQLTSSFTCQLISVVITTLIILLSLTLSLQAQNLPFNKSFPQARSQTSEWGGA